MRSRNNPTVNIEETEVTRKGINFSYTESFNKSTELTTSNYPSWKRKILYLFSINKLTRYVMKPIIIKLRKKDIKDDLSSYIEDELDYTLVYDKNTSDVDIDNDITTKWIIMNSLGEESQKLIEGNEKTGFIMWNILKGTFTKSVRKRKIELKDKIDNAKFNIDDDINIFVTTLQNDFIELEKIDHDITDSSKVEVLNGSLPQELRWINVFQYRNNWSKCCSYVKNIVSEIIFSNLKERNITGNNNTVKVLFNFENKNNKKKNIKKNKRIIRKRKNGRYNYCGIKGHYANKC